MTTVNKQLHFMYGGVKLFSFNDVERIVYDDEQVKGYFGTNIANYRRDILLEGVDYMKLQTSLLSKEILSRYTRQVVQRLPYLYAYTKNGVYKIADHLGIKYGEAKYRINVNNYFTEVEFDRILPKEDVLSTIDKNIAEANGTMMFSKSAVKSILNMRIRKILSLNEILELIDKISDEDGKISMWICLTEYINRNYDGKDSKKYLDIIDNRMGTKSITDEAKDKPVDGKEQVEKRHSERYTKKTSFSPYAKNIDRDGDQAKGVESNERATLGDSLLTPFRDSGVFVKLTGRDKPIFIRTDTKGYSITEIPGDLICISSKENNYILPKEIVHSISFK